MGFQKTILTVKAALQIQILYSEATLTLEGIIDFLFKKNYIHEK